MNEEIKNRILMEMTDVIGHEELIKLKRCMDRNFYGYTVISDTTEIVYKEDRTNESMLEEFRFKRGLEGTSAKTLEQYVRETKRFFEIVPKHYKEVTSDDVQYYLYKLMEMGTMSATSIDNARKFLKPFFKWLYENEKIPKDIFLKIKPIKRIEKQKEFLTDNEVVVIRDCCKNDIKALALIDTLLATGLRVSECSKLKISDIDFEKEEINVYSTKTNKWRKVYLDSNAKTHLLDYLKSRNDDSPYVFINSKRSGGKLTNMKNCSIEKLIQKYCEKAKINRHCTVHLFRKTMATNLYRHGMDMTIIAKLLGHTSVKTTERHYLSIREVDIKYLYSKCA